MATDQSASTMHPPNSLLGLPAEIKLNILHQVSASAKSSQDMYSLATSSKVMYQCFKNNEVAIFRRTVMRLITGPRGKSRLQDREIALELKKAGVVRITKAAGRHPVLDRIIADYIIKLGALCTTKPWPVDFEEIKQAVAHAEATSAPVNIDPSLYGGILAWLRHQLFRWQNNRYNPFDIASNRRVCCWLLDRSQFNVRHGLPRRHLMVFHPYEMVNPGTCMLVKRGDDWEPYLFHMKMGLESYEAHFNEPLSDMEFAMLGNPEYVPCCLAETCPRIRASSTGGAPDTELPGI